ncbi:MAG: SufD family Fe-S cluster assembly protein [Proteobacteria bacterium]|nr:SufD family Fe-S cluster assembly protein [Pseudomonadota bacterium]
MLKLDKANEIDLGKYSTDADEHTYVDVLSDIRPTDADEFEKVGIATDGSKRSATFILKDHSVIHCKTKQEGVELLKITQAMKKYAWLEDYMWNRISPDKDQFTHLAKEKPTGGFFARSEAGVKTKFPLQTCLHISKDGFSQNVHNIVIAEENSEMHIIAGCSTAPHLDRGLHVGVSEFYVKKGATLKYTMIHDWGENINVRPRTVTQVEEGGVFISNYISLKPVGSLQMNPTTYLDGRDSVARFNSVLVAARGTNIDSGSKVVLNAENARAEIISRAITTGGTIIARGTLSGAVPGVKGHLECKGLILNDGLLHAIPELEAHVPGVEMSHEAAVGKIDQREIEYLMARGLDEDEAVSTIVRGFLNVDIEGLPPSLAKKLDEAIADTQHDMM